MAGGIIHDFDLEIGRVFGFPLYWYGAVYTIGFLGVFGWFALRRRRLGWSMRDVVEFSVFMAAGILLVGRAFDILVYELDFYRDTPLQALNWWRGGMASHGVMLGGLAGVALFCRLRSKPFVETADELSVSGRLRHGRRPHRQLHRGRSDRIGYHDAVGLHLSEYRGAAASGGAL